MNDFRETPEGALIHRLANIVGDDVTGGRGSRIDAFVRRDVVFINFRGRTRHGRSTKR